MSSTEQMAGQVGEVRDRLDRLAGELEQRARGAARASLRFLWISVAAASALLLWASLRRSARRRRRLLRS